MISVEKKVLPVTKVEKEDRFKHKENRTLKNVRDSNYGIKFKHMFEEETRLIKENKGKG